MDVKPDWVSQVCISTLSLSWFVVVFEIPQVFDEVFNNRILLSFLLPSLINPSVNFRRIDNGVPIQIGIIRIGCFPGENNRDKAFGLRPFSYLFFYYSFYRTNAQIPE